MPIFSESRTGEGCGLVWSLRRTGGADRFQQGSLPDLAARPETGITVPRPPWRRERCNPLAKHGMPASSPPKMPVDARRGLLPYAVGCRGLPDSSVGYAPVPLFGGSRPCATLPPRAARGFLSEQLRSVATSRNRFRHACAMPGSAAPVPCDPDAAR